MPLYTTCCFLPSRNLTYQLMIKGLFGLRFCSFTKRSCLILPNAFEKSIVNILTARVSLLSNAAMNVCCIINNALIQLSPIRYELLKRHSMQVLQKTICRSFKSSCNECGVTFSPLKSAYSAGMSILASGSMLASFQQLRQDCRARDKFHKTSTTGERSSAWSFQIHSNKGCRQIR